MPITSTCSRATSTTIPSAHSRITTSTSRTDRDAVYVATDLHGHTLFSDGRATPEEYVDFRRSLGMRAIAIADHDVLRAVPRGAAAAAAAGMVFVPAVEVTAFIHFGTRSAEQIHILAYFPESFLRGPRLKVTALHGRGLRVEARWRDFVLE